MHRVQIGNSLVGYGVGAGRGEGSGRPGGEPRTLEESHRQCTGRGGGRKRKHSTRAPGKRAAGDGARPSLQVSSPSPGRREEAGVGRKQSRPRGEGLLCVWPPCRTPAWALSHQPQKRKSELGFKARCPDPQSFSTSLKRQSERNIGLPKFSILISPRWRTAPRWWSDY